MSYQSDEFYCSKRLFPVLVSRMAKKKKKKEGVVIFLAVLWWSSVKCKTLHSCCFSIVGKCWLFLLLQPATTRTIPASLLAPRQVSVVLCFAVVITIQMSDVALDDCAHTTCSMSQHLSFTAGPCGLQGCKNRLALFCDRMSYKMTKPGSVCLFLLA